MGRLDLTHYRGSALYQAGVLGGFTMLAAMLLVVGNAATRDAIEQRRAEDLLASLSQVIPSGSHDNNLLENRLTLTSREGLPVTVYRALSGLNVEAVAFQVTGQGYGGEIALILAIDAEGKILGARVLSHSETPGLGDKIEAARSDWILAFNGRSLHDPALERWAVKKDGGVFDQFTGATITPRAVVEAVKDGLALFKSNRDALLAVSITQPSVRRSDEEVAREH